MNENISYIPSRLKSAVKDGYVAGAVDILDDSLGLTQAEINGLVLGNSLNATFSTTGAVFIGSSSIKCTATFNTPADRITIYRGNYTEEPTGVQPIATANNITKLEYTDNTYQAVGGNNYYTAFFKKGGLTKRVVSNSVGVLHIYYGALTTYDSSNLTSFNTATTTVTRTYQMNLDGNTRKIYFKIPNQNVTGITKVELLSDGNYSPVNGSINSSLSDLDYNVWESEDAYNVTDAGNRSFVVNRQ